MVKNEQKMNKRGKVRKMAGNRNKEIIKDILKEVIWVVIMYIVYLLYALAFVFIFTFIMNSIIYVKVETVFTIGFIAATALSVIRLVTVIFRYRCSYKN